MFGSLRSILASITCHKHALQKSCGAGVAEPPSARAVNSAMLEQNMTSECSSCLVLLKDLSLSLSGRTLFDDGEHVAKERPKARVAIPGVLGRATLSEFVFS